MLGFKCHVFNSQHDDDTYPELYRKGSNIKGSNEFVPSPFCVGQLKDIYLKRSVSGEIEPEQVCFKVRKFYRPENTHKGIMSAYQADMNILYWSDEGKTLSKI